MIQTIVLTIALIGVILLIEPNDMSNPRGSAPSRVRKKISSVLTEPVVSSSITD